MISGKQVPVATDQIKVVNRTRINSRIGALSKTEVAELKDLLQRMLID